MTTAAELASYASSFPSFRNRIINGDMRIDQRNGGASVSDANSYTLDRWYFMRGALSSSPVFNVQQSSTAPSGFKNSLSVTVGTAGAPGTSNYSSLYNLVEGFNVADLGWGTVSAQSTTLSFWVYSSVTGTFGVAFKNNALDRSYIASYTINSANTWEYKTVTIAGDTSETATWLSTSETGIGLYWDMGVGTAQSTTAGSWQDGNFLGLTGGTKVSNTNGATWYITGVQLEVGTVATPFEHRPYGVELALCQRYYYRLTGDPQSPYGVCTGQSSTRAIAVVTFPVSMRTAPTALEQSGTATHYYIRTAGGDTVCNSVPTIHDKCTVISGMVNTYVASGLSAGYAAIAGSNNTSGYLGWSAEL